MALNRNGGSVQKVAPIDVVADQFVVIEGIGGVAFSDAKTGKLVALDITLSEFNFPLDAAVASFAVADKVYFNIGTQQFTTTAAGNARIGTCTESNATSGVLTVLRTHHI